MNPEVTTDDDIAELRMQALLTKRLNEAEVHSSQAQMDSQQRRDPSIQPPLANSGTVSGRNNIAVPIAGQLPIANLGYNLKNINSNLNPSLQNKGHYSGMKRNINQNETFNQRKGYHQQPVQNNSNNLVLALPQDKYSNKTNISSTINEKLPDKNLSARWQRMQNSGSDSSDSGSSDSDSSSSDSDSSSNSSSDSDSSSESTSTDEGEKNSKLKKKDSNLGKPIAGNVSKVEQKIKDEVNKNLSVMKDSKRSYSPWKSKKYSPNSSPITDLKTSHNESVTKFHDVGIPRKQIKSTQNEKPIEMMNHSPTLAKKFTEKNVESIGTNLHTSPLKDNKPDFEKSVTPQKSPVARSPRSLSPGYRLWLLKKGYIRSVSRELMSPLRKNSRSPPCRKSKSPFQRMSRSPFRRGSPVFRRGSKSPFRRASRSPFRRFSRSPIFRRRSRSRLTSRTPTKMSPLSPPRRKFIESTHSKKDSRSPRRRVSRSPYFRRGSKSPYSKRGSNTPPYRRKSRSSPFRSSRTPKKSKSPIYRRSSRSSIRRSSRSPYIRRGSRSPLSKNISRSLLRSSKSPKRFDSRSPRSRRDSSSQALRNSRSPVRHLTKCDKIARSPYSMDIHSSSMKNPKSPTKLSRSPNDRRSRSESPGYKAWLRERIRRSLSRKRKNSAERAKESVNGLRSPSMHRSEQLTGSKLITSPYKAQSQYKEKPLFFDETVTVSNLPGDTISHDQHSLIHPVSMPHDKRGPMPHDQHGPMPLDQRGLMPHNQRDQIPHDQRGPIPRDQRGLMPHNRRGPPPHDQRGPVPHDQRDPVPHDQCGPMIHDQRGPMPHDQRGPMPHDQRGPMPHDLRGPMPHDLRGPMPHDQRGPMPHDQRGPMPHDQRGPMPHDQRGPMSHDQRGPMSHDQRGPIPHDQRGPIPHDQRGSMSHSLLGPIPRDLRGPIPHDVRGPIPHDVRGPMPRDQRGPMPRDQRGPMPRDQRGPVPHDQRGPVPHDQRGPVPHDQRGPVPHDQRGPVPHDQRGPVPHGQRGPVPHGQRGPMPHGQRGPMPHDQRGPMPHDQRGPMPHDKRGPIPHDQRGPMPNDRRGPMPHDQRGPMPHDQRGPMPHGRRDPMTHDQRGPMTHDRRDPMPHDQRRLMLQDRRGRPMPGDQRMHEVMPDLMSQNDRNPIHPDHLATIPRIKADLALDDRGEPQSRDRGEPQSRDRGELRSRDRGEPRSRDRGEPRSRDRGEPRSRDRGEPQFRDRGEPRSRDRGEPRSPDRGEPRSPDRGEPRSPDRGEPRSRDRGEPRSRDRGEPLSRDRGEPLSRDRGEPLSRDRGEPLSRDRGEPLSRDRGEPLSHDKGEPLSRDRGEPLSRDRGEPLSRDRGEPLSRDRGEPLSRNRGEPLAPDRDGRRPRNKNEATSGAPLDKEGEMFYHDRNQTSESLDDRHRRRKRIHPEEHDPVDHSRRKLIHHDSTVPCHDGGGLMSSNKIERRKINRSRSPISSKIKDNIQSNDHYKVNEKEIKRCYQHEKIRANDYIEASKTISPKYRSSSPKDCKSSDSPVLPHRPHKSSSKVKGSHAKQIPDERKVVSGSNNIDIPPIRNRLDRSEHEVKDCKRSNKEIEARSNGGKGDGHQKSFSKSDKKLDMDGKRESKVKPSSHEDRSSLYKSKYEVQREKDRSEKSSHYNHKQKPNHDDLLKDLDKRAHNSDERPRSRSSRERKHRSKESTVAKKVKICETDTVFKNCSNDENKVSRSQKNSPSEGLSASFSSKNKSNEKPLIVIDKTDNDFNPNINSSEIADDIQKFIPVSKSNWTEITTSNDFDGDTKSFEKVSSELSTRDTPSLSPSPSKDNNLEEKLESSLVNQIAAKPTESDHEVDQIDDGKSLKDDCLNVLDQIMDCSGELKASRDFFEDFDDQPEMQHDINSSGNKIEKTDSKLKSNDRSRKENESNLSKGRASKDEKQEKKEFNYKSTKQKYKDGDEEETYRRKKYDDSYIHHKLHDSNASERKSSRSNEVASRYEDNLPKRKERNYDFDDKHSDRSKGSLERKRKRHESCSIPKHKEDKEGKIKEKIAKKRKRSVEPDSTQKKKKKKSKHKDESGDKEIKMKTSKKKKKEKKSKKSKKSKKHRSESKEVVVSVNQDEKSLRSKSPNDDLRQTLVRKPILKVVESPPRKNKTYIEDENSPVRISRKEEYLAYKRRRDNMNVAGIGHDDGRFSSKRDSKEDSNSGSRCRNARSRSSNGHHSRVRDAEMYSLPKRRMGTIQRTVYQGDGQEWSSKTDSRRRHQENVTKVPPPLMKQNVGPLLPDPTDEFVDKLPVHMRLGPSANAGPHPPKKANTNKGKRKGGRGRKSGVLPKRRN